MHPLDQLSPQDIRQCLQQAASPATADAPTPLSFASDCKEAAVLVPFLRMEDTWHLLYIRRSESELDRHSGQVAFAGGKRDAMDADLFDTALREAEEEIGIARQEVQVLGQLNHHYSISHYCITPVVATIPWPYPLQLQASEVDRAFTIPLQWLADPNHYEVRSRELNGHRMPVIYFREYDGELLWGATARMTLSLLDALNSHYLPS